MWGEGRQSSGPGWPEREGLPGVGAGASLSLPPDQGTGTIRMSQMHESGGGGEVVVRWGAAGRTGFPPTRASSA